MRINMVGEVDILDRDTRNLGYVRPEFYQYAVMYEIDGIGPMSRDVTVPAGYVYIVHAFRLHVTCDVNVFDRTLRFMVEHMPSTEFLLYRQSSVIIAGQTGHMELGPVGGGAIGVADVVFYLPTDPPGIAVPAGHLFSVQDSGFQAGDVWTYVEEVIQLPVP